MAANNPGIQTLLDYDPWRNSYFRALSIYITPLSFGEFAALCGPLGGFLVLHGEGFRDRTLGLAVIAASLASLFVSGSRGGAVGFLASMLLLGLLFVIRLWRTRPPDSFAAPAMTVVAAMAGGAAVTAVLTWKRLSNVVFGGGDSVGSTVARAEQLAMAWPHIWDSPVFGNGLGLGSVVLNWRPAVDQPASIDSYLVSLLIETGFPGALCYFGAIAVAAGACLLIYLRDRDPRAALSAPIGCALMAYGLYRLVLSQRENQTLAFILLALAFVCVRGARARAGARRRGSAAGSRSSADSPRPRSDDASVAVPEAELFRRGIKPRREGDGRGGAAAFALARRRTRRDEGQQARLDAAPQMAVGDGEEFVRVAPAAEDEDPRAGHDGVAGPQGGIVLQQIGDRLVAPSGAPLTGVSLKRCVKAGLAR